MTEEKQLVTSELNIFFDEDGNIGRDGGMHMKLILPGQPTPETLKAIIDRVHTLAPPEQEFETPVGKVTVTPPAARQQAPRAARAPSGGADIFKRIMGISHSLDIVSVQEYFGQFSDAELWTGDMGTKAPSKDWLETLEQQQLATIERNLRKMANEQKARA